MVCMIAAALLHVVDHVDYRDIAAGRPPAMKSGYEAS
jgi:hypothetical protein